MGEDVDDQGLEGCACGVCACEEDEKDFGTYVFRIEWLAFFVAGVDETWMLMSVFSAV